MMSACGGEEGTNAESVVVVRCCVDNSEHIYRIAADGGMRLLTAGVSPEWAPDHKSLGFLRSDDSPELPANQDAWSIDVATGVERRLTHVTPPNQVTAIAFGGKPAVIGYTDDSGIWLMSPEGGRPRRVVADGAAGGLSVSHGGSRIGFTRVTGSIDEPFGLYILDRPSATPRAVFRGGTATCGLSSPKWSPDDEWITFGLCIDKGDQDYVEGIWIVRADGTQEQRIATGTHPAWSNDGAWIAYITTKVNQAKTAQLSAVVKVARDGTQQTRVTPYVAGTDAENAPDDFDW